MMGVKKAARNKAAEEVKRMNEAVKIQVTDTGKAFISRVEDETSASEIAVSAAGITGWVRKRSLPENEFGFAGEVDFGSAGVSCNTNANEACIIRTSASHLSDLGLGE